MMGLEGYVTARGSIVTPKQGFTKPEGARMSLLVVLGYEEYGQPRRFALFETPFIEGANKDRMPLLARSKSR